MGSGAVIARPFATVWNGAGIGEVLGNNYFLLSGGGGGGGGARYQYVCIFASDLSRPALDRNRYSLA